MRRMIARYMPENLSLSRPCGASCDFRLEEKDGRVEVSSRGGSLVLLQDAMEQAALDTLRDALRERRYTGRELLDLLPEGTDTMMSFLLLNMLWYHGLVDQTAEE